MLGFYHSKNNLLIHLILISGFAASCLQGPGLFKQDKSDAAIDVTAIENGGVTIGSFKAGGNVSQQLGTETGAVAGTKVKFPAGSLSVDTEISIQQGADIASAGFASKLGISAGKISAAGPTVVLDSSRAVDASKPFSLEIPLSGSSLYLSTSENVIVLYKVQHATNNTIVMGVIPTSKLTVGSGYVRFETSHFGAYQAGFSEEKITAAVETKADTPILTQAEVQKLETIVWNLPDPVISAREVTFTATASGFAKLNFCSVSVYKQEDDSLLVFQTFKNLSGNAIPELIYTAPETTESYSAYAIFECEDKKGRFEASPASELVSIAGVENEPTPTPTSTPIPPPPGACQSEDAAFVTALGGCKDTATNLVWSSLSPNTMNWSQAVWDATYSENSNSQDSNDLGRTNDYPAGNGCTSGCDSSGTNYCHSLSEGGYDDWRVPSSTELQTVRTNGAATHLAGASSQTLWASDSWGSTASATVPLPTGTPTSQNKNTNLYVYCVRGGRAALSNVVIYSAPTTIAQDTNSQPIKIKLLDADGGYVNAENVALALSSSGAGSLGGTLTATTDVNGKASFDSFQYTLPGSVVFQVSGGGITPATKTINVIANDPFSSHICQQNDIYYATADGGCKDLTSGLVWSLPRPVTGTWYQAIWDQNYGSNAGSAEASDGARTNDYDPDPGISVGGMTDTHTTDYCHDLNEGGYTDWRVPTYIENSYTDAGEAATYYTPTLPSGFFWSSSTVVGTPASVYVRNILSGSDSSYAKSSAHNTICVRTP